MKTIPLCIVILSIFLITEGKAQNIPASFGLPYYPHINAGSDNTHVIIIPEVNIQEQNQKAIIFSYSNESENLITVDSLIYLQGESFALLYFRDHGVQDTADVIVSCINEEDLSQEKPAFSRKLGIPIGSYNTFGAFYGATQVAQWQPQPYMADPVYKDGYPVDISQSYVDNDCKDDFFWGKMWGYIIPPVSGSYKFFSSTEGEGIGNFYLSSDDSPSGLPAEDSPTAANGTASSFITLEAGKALYFEAFHKEIINDYFLKIEWIYPGLTEKKIISEPFLFSRIDTELPSSPNNLWVEGKGTNQVLISWDPANDNKAVSGYKIFLNGSLYNSDLIPSTWAEISNLKAETNYDIMIVAVDPLKNHSLPSPPVRILTYPPDENPPAPPQNLSPLAVTALSVQINWDAARDEETGVYGYNIYLNEDTKAINKSVISDTSFTIRGLDPDTEYIWEVTALDGSLNESDRSDPLILNTAAFSWDDKSEEAYIGKATITLDPLVPATGFAIEAGYGLESLLLANKISYNSFESPECKDEATQAELSRVGKFKSNAIVFRVDTETPFHGKKAAKLEVVPGEKFTAEAKIPMDPGLNYLIRIPAKKDALYSGEVGIRVYRDIGGVVTAFSGNIRPTEEWEVHELEFSGIQDASRNWKIEFNFYGSGIIYLDELQFYIKDRYLPGSKFSAAGLEILEELKPAGLRWGAIDANYQSFEKSTGPYQRETMTLGDFAELSSLYGDYVLLTAGVNSETDWYRNPETFSHFVEYLQGEAGSRYGDLRISEGYEKPFSTKLKGIILEMGNEVWAFNDHGADGFSSSYNIYTKWAAGRVKNQIRTSPWYDPTKLQVSFSGRSPEVNYGLHSSIFSNEDSTMDMLGVSGYMGGNLDYEAGVDPGKSQIDYHKNSYYLYYSKIKGLKDIFKSMFESMDRIVPLYMYEGNMSTPRYHGTIGQAVTFTDYYAKVMENGVALPNVFTLGGSGEWRMIDNPVTLAKRPLYHLIGEYNRCIRGVLLTTGFESMDSIYNASGSRIRMESLGITAAVRDSLYGVALFSRDFEHDFIVELNLPDNLGEIQQGNMVVLSGESFNAMNVTRQEKSIDAKDGMIITVPAHSAVFLSFVADNKNLKPKGKTGQYLYQKVEQINLRTQDGNDTITEVKGRKKILYDVYPENALYKKVKISVLENTAGAIFSMNYVVSDGITNGEVILEAEALDKSGVKDELTIVVLGQNVSVEQNTSMLEKAYPNPVSESLKIDLIHARPVRLELINTQGLVVRSVVLKAISSEINVHDLEEGIYMARLIFENETEMFRFIVIH